MFHIHKKKRWKVVLVAASGIVFVTAVIIFLPSFFNLFSKDNPPMDDSDLQLKAVSVPESDNAYFDLIKLEDIIIYEPEEKLNVVQDMISSETWDNFLAEKIVSRNSAAYEYFSAAAKKPKFQDPAFSDPSKISINTVSPPMDNWRRMARLSAIRALYLARQGKDAEAIGEALNSVKIGQKIQDSQAPLIEYLAAIAMKGVGLEAMQKIISASKLNSAALIGYINELDQFYKNESGLIASLKNEYQIQSKAIDSIVDKESASSERGPTEISEILEEYPVNYSQIRNPFYFQPEKTKALFAEYARTSIKNIGKPCGGIKSGDIPKLAPSSPIELYVTENAIGKILSDIVALNFSGIKTKMCEDDLLVAATQTLFAVRAYFNDNGDYPASLNELVPYYLASVPLDPFDGKSLRYSADEKILYSVGREMEDLGGSAGDDWRKMANPTFKIDF